jgi:hypothetical protein
MAARVAAACPHILAPLKHNGTDAQLNQLERGKEPCRPGANNHYLPLYGRYVLQLQGQEGAGLERLIHEHKKTEVDPDLPAAGIERSFKYLYSGNLSFTEAQCRAGGLYKKVFIGSLGGPQLEGDFFLHLSGIDPEKGFRQRCNEKVPQQRDLFSIFS